MSGANLKDFVPLFNESSWAVELSQGQNMRLARGSKLR